MHVGVVTNRVIRAFHMRGVSAFTCAVVAVAAAGASIAVRPMGLQATPSPIDDDSYAVYGVLLNADSGGRSERVKVPMFMRQTELSDRCTASGGQLTTDWRDVADHFAAENRHGRLLEIGRPLGRPYTLISRQDLDAIFKAGEAQHDMLFGWGEFAKRFPDAGGYTFYASAVGFNAARTHAMAFFGHSCGSMCGSASFHFLEKSGDRWKETTLTGVRACTISADAGPVADRRGKQPHRGIVGLSR